MYTIKECTNRSLFNPSKIISITYEIRDEKDNLVGTTRSRAEAEEAIKAIEGGALERWGQVED